MQASQTITLNEPISDQLTGVVLHWQAYDQTSGKEQNYDHNFCFIPKTCTHGEGTSVFMVSQNATHIANKYLYVSDKSIKGHENNYSNTTQSGITLDRRYFVLTEVLGV